ncbi:MAG: DUF6034 family protein [Christensenellales bacterium]
MKSCLMLTACLWLLCAPALAQTVPGMVQAPVRVARRFTSNTGKTVIEVDANVLVPEAEAAYILSVEIRAFEEEDAQRLALLIDPDAKWQKDADEERTGAYRSTAWIRWLFDRQLGYMPVLQRDSGQAFQLTPVWNFYGLNERDFEEDPHHSEMNEAHLTINALDGTVIDPAYGY